MNLKISEFPGTYVVAKLDKLTPDLDLLSQDSYDGEFISVCTTPDEVSVVCKQSSRNIALLKGNANVESGWAMIRVEGQLEFEMVGVVARFSSILAEAAIPLFCLSTFDTDYILVKESRKVDAIKALAEHGIELVN